MYDDLARSQKPGILERFVVSALIPSTLITFAIQRPPVVPLHRHPTLAHSLRFFETCPPREIMVPELFPVWRLPVAGPRTGGAR